MPTVVVVPCFNEEHRLERAEVLRLARLPQMSVLLVDDGSEDGTRALVESIARSSKRRVTTLVLDANGGKGEAVRKGLLTALASGATAVGYLDADFSTPVDELPRLHAALQQPEVMAVLGSRVRRAGADIHRRFTQHVTGRLFATAASEILHQPFYDTQCGAKLFRDTPALREALAEPFLSRWAFDVELLGRLLQAREPLPFSAFVEVPLGAWRDVDGSKLGLLAMARAGADLIRIQRNLAHRRRDGKRRA